jgi:impB/mucB/samB family protein
VLTCTYEARKFGIHSGMSVVHTVRLCPNAIYQRCDFERIREISVKFMEILQKYSNVFQKLGSVEAYLNISENASDFEEAEQTNYKVEINLEKKVVVDFMVDLVPDFSAFLFSYLFFSREIQQENQYHRSTKRVLRTMIPNKRAFLVQVRAHIHNFELLRTNT